MHDRQVWNKLSTKTRTEFPQEAAMTFARLQALPYLNAVIEKALRIYAVVPSTFSRRISADGASIAGNFVPRDFAIGVNGYAATVSEINFVCPAEFQRERWLGDPRFERDDEKAHQLFSTGPRNCLGKNKAMAFTRCKFTVIYDTFLANMS
jgi:cytochrome P450